MIRKDIKYKGDKYTVLRYGERWVLPVFSTYVEGLGSPLAMILFIYENGEFIYFCNVTVNLPDAKRDAGCQYIDTNNNGIDIVDWLEQNGFGKATGRFAQSGFCNYPEFNFYQGKAFHEFRDKEYKFLQ